MAKETKETRKYGMIATQFDNLSPRCKEVFFSFLNFFCTRFNAPLADVIDFSCIEGCKSPIEELFRFTFELMQTAHYAKGEQYYFLTPQEEIRANGHTYYADFLFDTIYQDDGKGTFDNCKRVKIIFECDGHDFHEKTKEQVARGNERDMNLKLEGYEVIHFSGSQIYNDPIACASDAYKFISKRLKEQNGGIINGKEEDV